MDMLKSGIGLQAFAERDPRVLYKKEGYRYFQQMMTGIRDKVTDLIFRARVVGRAEARSAYRETAAVHEDTGGYGVSENLAATAGVDKGATVGSDDPTGCTPEDDGGGAATAVKVKTIVNEAPRVGRNDPCPCGAGKKYKKCCGKDPATRQRRDQKPPPGRRGPSDRLGPRRPGSFPAARHQPAPATEPPAGSGTPTPLTLQRVLNPPPHDGPQTPVYGVTRTPHARAVSRPLGQ